MLVASSLKNIDKIQVKLKQKHHTLCASRKMSDLSDSDFACAQLPVAVRRRGQEIQGGSGFRTAVALRRPGAGEGCHGAAPAQHKGQGGSVANLR